MKPPDGRASFAANEQPAITDGSSVAIGTRISFPSMMKFVATPTGVMQRPMQFSTMESAVSRSRARSGDESELSSSGVRLAMSRMRCCLSSSGNLKKPGMADDIFESVGLQTDFPRNIDRRFQNFDQRNRHKSDWHPTFFVHFCTWNCCQI